MSFNALMKPTVNQTRAQVEAIGTAGNGVAGFFYMTSDTNAAGQQVYGVGQSDGSIAFLGYEGDAPLQSVGTTPTVSMAVDGNGEVTANVQFGAAADNIASDAGDGIYVPSLKIHADSQGLLEYDQATNALRMTSLADKTKIVDTTSVDLDAAIAAHYATGTELQVGDVIYLNNATGGSQIWVNTIGKDDTAAGDASDFIQWSGPDLTDDYILNLISGGNGIDYNPSTGVVHVFPNPAANNDVIVDGDGVLLDVSAAPVTDTNNLLGGGVVDVSLQSLLDEISGTNHFDNFQVSGDAGTMLIDEGNNDYSIKGVNLLKTAIGSNYDMTVGLDTTGAIAGQTIKVVDDGSGNLVPAWGLDSASGFQEFSVPFAAADGTLTESQSNLSYRNDNDAEIFYLKIGAGEETATGYPSNLNPNIDDVSIHISGHGNKIYFGDNAQQVQNAYIGESGGGDTDAMAIHGKRKVVLSIGFDPTENSTDATKVEDALVAHGWGQGAIGKGTIELPFYGNDRNDYTVTANASNVSNLLFTTPEGYVRSLGVGAAGEVLKSVNDGSGNITMQWAVDASDLSFINGVTEANGQVKLGGALTQNTSINLSGNGFTWAGNAGDSVRSSIDQEFLNANVGTIYVAPEDGTKWRVGVSSLGNGAATFTLNAVV